jgi:glycosyltransferase involved in cell wall biosynthesis
LSELTIVDLSRNFGHMHAVSAGLLNAKGKAVVVMDGDLQDPPELIPKLFAKWQKGAEVVLANRANRAEGAVQKIFTKLFYWTIGRISSCPIPKQVGTFCLIDRRVVKVINEMPERVRFFAGLRAWTGYRNETVTYDRPDRRNGDSKVGFWGQVKLAKNGIVSFSNWPLLWLSRLSLLASLLLFFFGLTIVGIKLFSNLAIPGWASTMVLIGIVASMNSVVFAVFSEYLAVIFEEIKQRPHFLKSQIYRNGKAEEDIRSKKCQKDSLNYRIHYT